MHWSTGDVMCHLAVETRLWLRTCTGSKIQFSENNGKIFEDKLQQGKRGNVIKTDFGNVQNRRMAWDRQTEAYTYWRERDHCGENGRLAKPQRPETDISFNTPDIQRNGFNKTQHSTNHSLHFLVGSVFCISTRLLSIIVSFFFICILQGSVVTQLMYGGIFNNQFIANCHKMQQWKNIKNWLIFGEDMDKSKVARFLAHPVFCYQYSTINNFAKIFFNEIWCLF